MVDPSSVFNPTYFVAGGTVPPGSPSYVERSADRELFEALLAGEFCYVLNSRQMGKSSLAVRTIAKLNEAGVRTAFLDLTRLGSAGATPDRWYAGLLLELGRALGQREVAAAAIKGEGTPVGKLLGFLTDALEVAPLVVFIDEVDATRTLPFSADDLFAGIRQAANSRATDPRFEGLTFCLLGAALPSDLIRDARITPFNVGRRIELRDFTVEEARPFASQIGDEALARVLYWTGGHPFLTQALCAELSISPVPSGGEGGRTGRPGTRSGRGVRAPDVDALVQSRYLDARARETDTNLTDVGRRLLGEGDANVGDEGRATTLALYERMLRGRPVADDEANPAAARIKMSGVARVESGDLRLRNQIYREAFGASWVKENTPGQELRRQRKAFWRGALRTGAIATVVIAVVSTLAVIAFQERNRSKALQAKAEYETYVASIRTLPLALEEGNLYEIDRTLEPIKGNSARGWEWDYWHHVANPGRLAIPVGRFRFDRFSKDGNFVYGMSWRGDAIKVIDLRRQEIVRTIPLRLSQASGSRTFLVSGDRRQLIVTPRGLTLVVDLMSGAEIRRRQLEGLNFGTEPRLDAGHLVALQGNDVVSVNTETLETKLVKKLDPAVKVELNVSPDGRHVAWTELSKSKRALFQIVVARSDDFSEIDRFEIPDGSFGSRFSPDGRTVAVSGSQDKVIFRDFLRRTERTVALSNVALSDIKFSLDGRQLIAFYSGRKAFLWDLATNRTVRTFDEAYTAGFTPSGRQIYTEYWSLRLYDASAASDLRIVRPRKPWVTASLSYSGDLIYWAPGESVVVDLMRPDSQPAIQPTTTKMFALSPSKTNWIRLSDDSKRIEFGRFGTSMPDLRLPMPANANVAGLASSDDLRYVALQGRVYARPDSRSLPQPVATLLNDGQPGFASFSSNGKWLVSSDASGLSILWRIDHWDKPLWTYRATSPGTSRVAAYSPDWKQIALSTNLDDAVILDRTTGREVLKLIGHSQWVNDVKWSPDGKRIATGSDDGTVRLWDAETGKQLCILGRHESAVMAIRFLPGGRTLASLGSDKLVKLWMTEDRP